MQVSSHRLVMAALLAVSPAGYSAISIASGGQIYTQDFNSLQATGSGISWTNDSTLPGWSLFNGAGLAIGTYAASAGGDNAGSFYSFGTAQSIDRALGGVGAGSAYFGSPAVGAPAGWIVASFTNDSAFELSGFSIQFDGEQWRDGGNTSTQTMALEYGFGSSFASVSSWQSTNFSWASPVATSTAGAVNGNIAGRVAAVGGTINASWFAGNTLWLRWAEINDLGTDHGLAIDDVQFTAGTAANPVPVPAAAWLLGSGILGLYSAHRSGRRRNWRVSPVT